MTHNGFAAPKKAQLRSEEGSFKFYTAVTLATILVCCRKVFVEDCPSLKCEPSSEELRHWPPAHHDTEQPSSKGDSYLSNKLCILMLGRNGVGKSTLIEGLIGEPIPKGGTTNQFTTTSLNVNDVNITLLFVRSLKEEKYIEELRSSLPNVDLIIYAIKMDDSRIRPADTTFLRTLCKSFGLTLWSKAMFVLTFANRVQVLDANHVLQFSEAHFKLRVSQWEDYIRKVLFEEGLSNSEIHQIPIVPVGHPYEPEVFDKDWTKVFQDAMTQRLFKSSLEALSKFSKFY